MSEVPYPLGVVVYHLVGLGLYLDHLHTVKLIEFVPNLIGKKLFRFYTSLFQEIIEAVSIALYL